MGRRISSLSTHAFTHSTAATLSATQNSDSAWASRLQRNLRFTAAEARAYSSFLCTPPSAFPTEACQSEQSLPAASQSNACGVFLDRDNHKFASNL